MKCCFTCKETKPLTAFWKHCISKDGHSHICRACRSEQRRADYRENLEIRRAEARANYANNTHRRENAKAKARAWHARNRQRKKHNDLMKMFGIGLEEYNAMFAAQGGCCAICQRHQSEFKRALATDHDHASGKVRSLLCSPCNSALGHMQDDPERMERAAVYIRRHKMQIVKNEVMQ